MTELQADDVVELLPLRLWGLVVPDKLRHAHLNSSLGVHIHHIHDPAASCKHSSRLKTSALPSFMHTHTHMYIILYVYQFSVTAGKRQEKRMRAVPALPWLLRSSNSEQGTNLELGFLPNMLLNRSPGASQRWREQFPPLCELM